MAAVSQRAMRRHPGGPLDPSASIRSPAYYNNSYHQQDNQLDKTKKSWSQRLKLAKPDKQVAAQIPELPLLSSPSALSRSMKYAEPWLYGTVRGMPSSPGPKYDFMQPQFTIMPELAVVLCSCREYLTGTKREVKKATVCKKCKGSRLPITPIGGTVRIHSSQCIIQANNRNSVGTVRLPSTYSSSSKQRPSILNADSDPYDVMRRSRLLSPDLKSVNTTKATKNRAKSSSPVRNKDRYLKQNAAQIVNVANGMGTTKSENRSRSATRLVEIESSWTDSMDSTNAIDMASNRRSILQCNINPYELISKTLHNNEFAPMGEDDVYDMHSQKYENLLNSLHSHKSVNTNSINAPISRDRSAPKSTAVGSVSSDDTTYEKYNFSPPVSTYKSAKDNNVSVSTAIGNGKNESIVVLRHAPDVPSKPIAIESISTSPRSECRSPDPPEPSAVIENGTSTIKSILKRPHVTVTNGEETNVNKSCAVVDAGHALPQNGISSKNSVARRTPKRVSTSLTTTGMNPVTSPVVRNTKNNIHTVPTTNNHAGKGNNRVSVATSTDNGTKVKRDSESHFYLPLPQRKKVQFLVEHEIIDESNNMEMNGDNGWTGVDAAERLTPATENSLYETTKKASGDNAVNGDVAQHKGAEQNSLNGTLINGHENARDKKTDKNQQPDKKKLQRSLSDRRVPDPLANINFQDTTALRARATRSDSRDLFTEPNVATRGRPSVPPPPPPSVRANLKTPIRPPRQNAKRTGSTVATNSKPMKVNAATETHSKVQKIPIQPPSTATATPLANSPENNQEIYVQRKRIQANNEAFQGSRLFNTPPNTPIKKTVVKVAPLVIHKESDAIHRLEVRNEQDDYESFKRTSVLISGDDCYSTINVNDDTPIYQASVVVNDVTATSPSVKMTSNTITINVTTPTTPDDLIQHNNKLNAILSASVNSCMAQKGSLPNVTNANQAKTTIFLDYKDTNGTLNETKSDGSEINLLFCNPVEAVKLNLVPHVCGKTSAPSRGSTKAIDNIVNDSKKLSNDSFISKLLEDPTLGHLAEGLDSELVARLIENSLVRLKESRSNLKISGTKNDQDMNKLIENSLQKVKEERQKLDAIKSEQQKLDEDKQSNRDSMSSGNSFSSANYELFDFESNDLSDCYQSCSSELTTDEDGNVTRNKFYQMLVDATLCEIEISTSMDDEHHYESIRLNGGDPIYEEISDIPPPLPLCPPPTDVELDKKNAKSMFEGASKYDILSYLVDAKERGIVPEDSYTFNFPSVPDISVDGPDLKDVKRVKNEHNINGICRTSQLSTTSDTGDERSLTPCAQRKTGSDIERNDSGVGSETSKSSRSKYQSLPGSILDKNSPIHLCEDCDGPVETQVTDSGVMFAPLVCRKCGKKRAERKEIITEIVETEEKYGRDLQIILEEFYQPMLVAGLLTQEQLSAIFLNTEELLENSQSLSEKMRDALDIANEQGDDDLLTVNIGKLILEAAPMLHAFESYCIRQAAASLLLANLEKEKELLRIFLRVSQMENTVLRRMNLNSFLMVPVQRVTKYPLLLARLYKVTPAHLKGRDMLKQAQEKIELHLNHMNREAKDIPTKLWRRISSSSPGRRSTCEIDMINIKLRKMSIDLLEWNHDEVRFAVEGKLLFTQPADSNWRRGRTIKLAPVNALLVTNGKPTTPLKLEKFLSGQINFPKHTGIREAALLLVREKSGRYTVLREPLFLDRCIVCTEAEWEDYFEVHEISSKETFIFKAEDGDRTKQWYTQLQYHAQGMGAWRKRRNALANIMINGMMRA